MQAGMGCRFAEDEWVGLLAGLSPTVAGQRTGNQLWEEALLFVGAHQSREGKGPETMGSDELWKFAEWVLWKS